MYNTSMAQLLQLYRHVQNGTNALDSFNECAIQNIVGFQPAHSPTSILVCRLQCLRLVSRYTTPSVQPDSSSIFCATSEEVNTLQPFVVSPQIAVHLSVFSCFPVSPIYPWNTTSVLLVFELDNVTVLEFLVCFSGVLRRKGSTLQQSRWSGARPKRVQSVNTRHEHD